MIPTEILCAVSRLNSHARAFGCGKRAIYAYKLLVSALAVLDDIARVTLRQWTGTCHGCNGTGRYLDSYGERWPHCRACSSTGRVTLKFVEVELDGHCWHHPFDGSSGVDIAAIDGCAVWDGVKGRWTNRDGNEPIFWNFQSDWAPKQPGERLEPSDAAMLLNVVEAFVLTVPLRVDPAGRIHWIGERAKSEMRRYTIDLGRLPGPCWRCAADPDIGLSRSIPPFSFATPSCRVHASIEPAFWPSAVPDDALTPALREWRDRHVALGFDRSDVHWA